MKSTIYKALIGATLITGLSSCVNNWLNVEPGDQVEADEAVTTSADLSSVRAGMYQIIKGTSDFKDYYAARMFYYGEVRGDSYFKKHLVRMNSTYFTPCTHIFFILPKFIRRIFNDIFSNIQ